LELGILLLGTLIINIWGDMRLLSRWVDIILMIIVIIWSLVIWRCLFLSFLSSSC